MQKHYPTGTAQDVALKALGETAEHFENAEALFRAYGLSITPVRKGRSSVPSIGFASESGAFDAYGEGDTWDLASKYLSVEQIEALIPYFTPKAQLEAGRRVGRLQSR